MSARRLQGETGATPQEMRAEIASMVNLLSDLTEQMSDWEARFITDMADNLTSDSWVPTPAQLFKCRDINQKY